MKDETFIIIDVTLISILFCTYSFVLVFAIRNSYKYVYKMKNYSQIYFTSFYVLTVIICVSRLIDKSLRVYEDFHDGGFGHTT